MGDVAIVCGIGLDVGIKQIEADMPHASAPHLGHHRTPGEFNADSNLGAGRIERWLDRHGAELGIPIARVLVALGVDDLGEIALPVEQTHPDEGQADIAAVLQ